MSLTGESGGSQAELVYLRPEDVARRLNVSRKTISRLIGKKQIPFTRLPGGTIRFHPERLEVWVDQRTNGTRHHIRLATEGRPNPVSRKEATGGAA